MLRVIFLSVCLTTFLSAVCRPVYLCLSVCRSASVCASAERAERRRAPGTRESRPSHSLARRHVCIQDVQRTCTRRETINTERAASTGRATAHWLRRTVDLQCMAGLASCMYGVRMRRPMHPNAMLNRQMDRLKAEWSARTCV